MYKCNECGCIFADDEIHIVQEYGGEYWGFPAYESLGMCPNCSSMDFDDYYGEEREDDEEMGIVVKGVHNVDHDHERYLVARVVDHELWFWGSWATLNSAERVASQFDNGVVVDTGDDGHE